jgi:hypothetical protein
LKENKHFIATLGIKTWTHKQTFDIILLSVFARYFSAAEHRMQSSIKAACLKRRMADDGRISSPIEHEKCEVLTS